MSLPILHLIHYICAQLDNNVASTQPSTKGASSASIIVLTRYEYDFMICMGANSFVCCFKEQI